MADLDGPIVTFDDSEGALTFGIEIEWLSPFLWHGDPDPDPEEPRPVFTAPEGNYSAFGEELTEFELAPLKAAGEDIVVRDEADDRFIEPFGDVPEYDHWRMCSDCSVVISADDERSEDDDGSIVMQTDRHGYDWVGREITSEVLSAKNPAYPRKITDICRAIRTHRAHLNSSASIHVHVGRANDGFTLLTVKKFATLIWLTESQLLGLHHPSRQNNGHCPLMTKVSKLATLIEYGPMHDDSDVKGLQQMERHVPSTLESTVACQLRHLWALPETDEFALSDLAGLMATKATDRRGSVGFRRFKPKGKMGGNTNTLEFRQMGACLDPEPILNWVRVCIGIVDFARLSDAATFKSLLETITKGEDKYTGINLLSDLGLKEEAAFFERKVAGYKSGDPEALAFYDRGPNGDGLFLSPLTPLPPTSLTDAMSKEIKGLSL